MKDLVAETGRESMAESEATWPNDVLPIRVERATRGIIAGRVLIGTFVTVVFVGALIAAWPILLVGATIVALSTGVDAWARQRRASAAVK